VAVVMAFLVVVFFAEVVSFLGFLKSGKNNQPVRRPRRSLWLVAFWVLGFFAVALRIHPQHCAALFLCHRAVLCAAAFRFVPLRVFLCRSDFFVSRQLFVPRQCALCRGNVVSAVALCFVPRPSMICFGIAPCAAFCAVVVP